MTMTGKFKEPIGAHMLYAGEIADTTAKGLLAYPGIEKSKKYKYIPLIIAPIKVPIILVLADFKE